MNLHLIFLLLVFLFKDSGIKEINKSIDPNLQNKSAVVNSTIPKIHATLEDCKFKDIQLYGKVKFVESFGDIKIQFVESFPDIRVKFVSSFPNECGKWQVVESFPDFTVQIVESFPDLKVETVDSFPGMK